MKLIERAELIGNYKSKIEKVTLRTYSDRIAPPRQGGDRRRAFRRWGKAGNDNTSARGRGFRAFRERWSDVSRDSDSRFHSILGAALMSALRSRS